MCQIWPESLEFYRRYYEKQFGLILPAHTVHLWLEEPIFSAKGRKSNIRKIFTLRLSSAPSEASGRFPCPQTHKNLQLYTFSAGPVPNRFDDGSFSFMRGRIVSNYSSTKLFCVGFVSRFSDVRTTSVRVQFDLWHSAVRFRYLFSRVPITSRYMCHCQNSTEAVGFD